MGEKRLSKRKNLIQTLREAFTLIKACVLEALSVQLLSRTINYVLRGAFDAALVRWL